MPAFSIDTCEVFGSLHFVSTGVLPEILQSLVKLAHKSLWQFPGNDPWLPVLAMVAKSWPLDPVRIALWATSWTSFALSCPWLHKDKSVCASTLCSPSPLVKGSVSSLASSKPWPLSLLTGFMLPFCQGHWAQAFGQGMALSPLRKHLNQNFAQHLACQPCRPCQPWRLTNPWCFLSCMLFTAQLLDTQKKLVWFRPLVLLKLHALQPKSPSGKVALEFKQDTTLCH